jgi:hypothetical protein
VGREGTVNAIAGQRSLEARQSPPEEHKYVSSFMYATNNAGDFIRLPSLLTASRCLVSPAFFGATDFTDFGRKNPRAVIQLQLNS